MSIYSLKGNEAKRYGLSIGFAYLATLLVYIVFNAILDSQLRGLDDDLKTKLENVAKVQSTIFDASKAEDPIKTFSDLEKDLSLVKGADSKKILSLILYGDQDIMPAGGGWWSAKKGILWPILEQPDFGLDDAMKELGLKNKKLKDAYNKNRGEGNKTDQFNFAAGIFANDYLGKVIDDVKKTFAFRFRRYLNGTIQVVTFILAFTGLSVLIIYMIGIRREEKLFNNGLKSLQVDSIGDWSKIESNLKQVRAEYDQELEHSFLLSKMASTLDTFCKRGKEEAHQVLTLEIEEIRQNLDSRYGLLKYFAWAVPSVGFIGTVIGIGDALGSAHNVIGQEGNFQTKGAVQGITSQLGVAFDTTLIALFLSIILVFGLHVVTRIEETKSERALLQVKKVLAAFISLEKENQLRRFRHLLESLNRWTTDSEIVTEPFIKLKEHLIKQINPDHD